nr:hypothetical protein MarFTME_232 [Marseillevirus futianmevirus]
MPFCVCCGSWVQNPKFPKGETTVFCGKGCETKGNFCPHTGLPERIFILRQNSSH